MDMFMDKLAQKLTAQEIIRANTAADTEELNRLRNQIAEYNDCLAKLQKLVDDGAEKLQVAQTDGAELGTLVEENIGRMGDSLRENISQLTGRLEELDNKLVERLTNINRIVGENLESIDESMDEKLSSVNEPVLGALTGLERALDDRLDQIDNRLVKKLDKIDGRFNEKPEDPLTEKLTAIDENVHKECVKVYRNVQAVIMDESEKQKDSLSDISSEIFKTKQQVQTVLKISAAALAVSALGLIAQVLDMLHILPF